MYTPIPNFVLDGHLPTLSESELKIVLVIIRQTLGWKDKKTGGRKMRDRICISQFIAKTGLSKRVISIAIQKLIVRELIEITDTKMTSLVYPSDRKGKSYLFYSVKIPAHLATSASAESVPKPAHNCYHNKTKRKEAGQKPQPTFRTSNEIIANHQVYGIAS